MVKLLLVPYFMSCSPSSYERELKRAQMSEVDRKRSTSDDTKAREDHKEKYHEQAFVKKLRCQRNRHSLIITKTARLLLHVS